LLVNKHLYCQLRSHDLPMPALHFCSRACAIKLQKSHPNLKAALSGTNFQILTTVCVTSFEAQLSDRGQELYDGSAPGNPTVTRSVQVRTEGHVLTLTPIRESESYGYEPRKKFKEGAAWPRGWWSFFRLLQIAPFERLG
jgi:hypothetical protein